MISFTTGGRLLDPPGRTNRRKRPAAMLGNHRVRSLGSVDLRRLIGIVAAAYRPAAMATHPNARKLV